MLNVEHLQTFLAVTETGSFTAAAAKLGFTQPAVSQQIRALETQVGTARLFRRAGSRMQLTQAGELLLSYARDLVALADRAERQMQGLHGTSTSRIELACAPSTGEHLVPALLAAFRGNHPEVQFSVEVGSTERLLGWLGEGVVQAVIGDEHPRRRTVEVLDLGSEPIVCIAARGHHLLQGGPVTLNDVRDCPLIMPQRGTALRRTLEEQFRRRSGTAAPFIVLETDSVGLAAQAAGNGLGLAFVPQQSAPRSRDLGTVRITDWQVAQSWFLIRQRASERRRAIDDLWEFAASPNGRKLIQRLGLR